ncbi:copper resistance CopC family protein [Pseudarthrobacter sp. NPDC080039]|uniref:copper resistance CopC family protein n=1 Tax=unclassified Pseudarthrobacter TaxID=2647000 RepID=UPI00345004EC
MKTQPPGPATWMGRLLLLLTTAAFVMASPVAAQAHDVLVSSTPANGSTVSTVPTKVGLTFDHTPIAINSIVRVQDATGTDQADGPVSIVDNRVTQAVKPDAPSGKYTVVWRVVSSDGHPIEGTFTFTAGTANAGSPPPATPANTTPGNGAQTGITVAIAAGAALILAFVALALVVRRRLRNPGTEN